LTVQQNLYSSSEVSMLQRTLKLNPENVRVRYNLAYVYAQNEYFIEAEEEFRKVLEITPNVVNGRIALGKTLVGQGRFWEGIREYEWIQDPGGLRDTLDGNLKVAYRELIKDYQTKIAAAPEDSSLYFGLGVAYSKTNQVDLAAEQFRKAVELNPDDEYALFNLGSALVAQGKPREAVDFFIKLLGVIDKDHMLYAPAGAKIKSLFDQIGK